MSPYLDFRMQEAVMYSLDEEENDEENEEKLPGDYSSPLSPPEGTQDRISEDAPALDTGADIQEWYDGGREAAAGESDRGNEGIRGYHPPGYTPPKNGPPKSHSVEEDNDET